MQPLFITVVGGFKEFIKSFDYTFAELFSETENFFGINELAALLVNLQVINLLAQNMIEINPTKVYMILKSVLKF